MAIILIITGPINIPCNIIAFIIFHAPIFEGGGWFPTIRSSDPSSALSTSSYNMAAGLETKCLLNNVCIVMHAYFGRVMHACIIMHHAISCMHFATLQYKQINIDKCIRIMSDPGQFFLNHDDLFCSSLHGDSTRFMRNHLNSVNKGESSWVGAMHLDPGIQDDSPSMVRDSSWSKKDSFWSKADSSWSMMIHLDPWWIGDQSWTRTVHRS